jgi:hypothetical protein
MRGGDRGYNERSSSRPMSSSNTIQMVNRGNWEEKMYKDVTGESLEYEDPRKHIRDFYREFCDSMKSNMRTTHSGEEVFLHDLLLDMNFLGHEG